MKTAEIGKVLKDLRTLGLEVIIQPRGPAANRPPADHNNVKTGLTNDTAAH